MYWKQSSKYLLWVVIAIDSIGFNYFFTNGSRAGWSVFLVFDRTKYPLLETIIKTMQTWFSGWFEMFNSKIIASQYASTEIVTGIFWMCQWRDGMEPYVLVFHLFITKVLNYALKFCTNVFSYGNERIVFYRLHWCCRVYGGDFDASQFPFLNDYIAWQHRAYFIFGL